MKEISGKCVRLQLIEDEDIEFIVDLRNNHKHRTNLDSIILTYDGQKVWMKEYKKREKLKQDFYFLIKDLITDEKIGLIRVYDIQEDSSFEQGSLILKEGLNPKYILEVFILIYKFAFDELRLNTGRLRVKTKNKVGNRFHESYGAKLYLENQEIKYYNLKKEVIKNLEKILIMFGG